MCGFCLKGPSASAALRPRRPRADGEAGGSPPQPVPDELPLAGGVDGGVERGQP